MTGVYNPKTFILHATSHRQAFAHCECFSTAASRRSLGSISVPVWLTILSDQLTVIALVSRYLTNKLIVHGFSSKRQALRSPPLDSPACAGSPHSGLSPLSRSYTQLEDRLPMYSSPFRHCPPKVLVRKLEPKASRSTCMPNPRRQRSF